MLIEMYISEVATPKAKMFCNINKMKVTCIIFQNSNTQWMPYPQKFDDFLGQITQL